MKTVRNRSQTRPPITASTMFCWRQWLRRWQLPRRPRLRRRQRVPHCGKRVNYTRLVPAQPTAVPAGQVEVLEFFWYACPHCYALDPLVESWKKSKPAYVSFSRVPVMWSEGHRSTARLYYTLESLGKLDQLHGEVFKEIHVNNDPLIASDPNDVAGAERIQATFLKRFGISEDEFKKASHSFTVETDLQRADELGQRYRIEGVPTFVINGKYIADVRSAGGPEKLIALVGDLAAQEHKH
jgi:thiol:disulfide interchange protein DsbA